MSPKKIYMIHRLSLFIKLWISFHNYDEMPVNQLNSHNWYIGGNFTSFGTFLATNQYHFYLLENLQSLSNFEIKFNKIYIQLRIKFLCKKRLLQYLKEWRLLLDLLPAYVLVYNHTCKLLDMLFCFNQLIRNLIILFRVYDFPFCFQVHGGGGVSSDFCLAHLFAGARVLRLADGPDEVHLRQVAKFEYRKARL